MVIDTVRTAWEKGIRYFDTAPFYGFGLSERRLGDELRRYPREEYVLSTKVGRLLEPTTADCREPRHGFHSPMPFEPEYDYSYDGIMRSFEDSQQRLGLSQIDILLMHDLGRVTHGDKHEHYMEQARSGGFNAMQSLKDQGVIKAIGLGVNEYEICEESLEHADFDCFMLAGRYTLLEQKPLDGFFDLCKKRGAQIIAAGIYNSGILAAGTRSGNPIYFDYEIASDEIVARVKKIETVCDAFNISLANVALHFPGAHPQVATTLVGMTGKSRVEKTSEQFEVSIPSELWKKLKEQGLLHADAPTPT